MKKIIAVLILEIFSTLCFAQKIENILKDSYKRNDLKTLDKFFEIWRNETRPLSESDYICLSDTIKDVYDIFSDFYTPFNLSRVGSSEWGDSIYYGVSNIIVQNDIRYSIVKTLNKKEIINSIAKNLTDSLEKKEFFNSAMRDTSEFTLGFAYYGAVETVFEDTIKTFRPRLFFENVSVVYLTPEYYNVIDNFLKKKHFRLGKGNIMNPARAKGKSKNRLDFLNKKVKIFHGHWGGYWQMNTYPKVFEIILDSERKTAIISFRIVYEGGEAMYKKINDKWTLIESKRTWIE